MVSNSTQKEEGLSGESVSETEKKKQCCSDCKVTRTPCWRNGPSGPKTLCNACGLKYAKKKKKRTRGKKEVMVPLEKGVLNRGLLLLPGVVKKKQRSPRRHWSEVERAALLLMSLSSSSSSSSSSFSGARFSERIFYPGSFVSHLT